MNTTLLIVAVIVAFGLFFLAYVISGYIETTQQAGAKWQHQAGELEKQNHALRAQLRETEARLKTPPNRALAWPKPAQRMEASDLLGEFDVPLDEPWYAAVHQELDDAISDLLDEVTQVPGPQLTTERRTHLAGGAESLRAFQQRLLQLRHRASATDPDLAEQAA
jgi:hypothetical protein